MKIHEYQAKQIFQKYAIPTPNGFAAFSVDEALTAAKKLKGPLWVVKAQIHAGGRGKAGGVKLAKSLDEVSQFAKELLGKKLITIQTGPAGTEVKRLLIEEGAEIERELYLAITLDRASSKLVIMASSSGGMDIEEVAHKTPEKICKEHIEPLLGLRSYQIRRISKILELQAEAAKQLPSLLNKLIKLYNESDCALAEINPLIVTKSQNLVALDAKMLFDDNALFKHPELLELEDPNEISPQEKNAKKFDLNYISLDGTIGCMVNGAGLAMATMDIIKLSGGEPANFLDVGGGATEDKVREAFKIILSDKNVKAILVNIFGGIMKCDIIASGIVAAAKELSVNLPLVVRLEGTNVELGKKILSESKLKIVTATEMKDAAQKAVLASRGEL